MSLLEARPPRGALPRVLLGTVTRRSARFALLMLQQFHDRLGDLSSAVMHSRHHVVHSVSRHARAIPPRSASSAEPWLTLQQAVELVRAAPETLQAAVAAGDLEAHHPLANGPWLFRRESLHAWNSSRRGRRGRTAPTAAQLDLAIPRR